SDVVIITVKVRFVLDYEWVDCDVQILRSSGRVHLGAEQGFIGYEIARHSGEHVLTRTYDELRIAVLVQLVGPKLIGFRALECDNTPLLWLESVIAFFLEALLVPFVVLRGFFACPPAEFDGSL